MNLDGFKNGAGERNRTSDLRVTSALLYQLSYSSKNGDDYQGTIIIGDDAAILNHLSKSGNPLSMELTLASAPAVFFNTERLRLAFDVIKQ